NIHKLKTQQMDGFVKVAMNYLRHNKNSYFCYLPLEIYSQLSATQKPLSINSLEQEIKRKKLIPIKYCRKWFYTKCIELGIPDTIADYYQGRTANSVGSNHYLSRQMLADKNYDKIVTYLKSFRL
ncbi:integrase, partial [Methanoculleus sp.]|uniref:integrase n=1 Tax=Methanoculleus sp. TaxID=90427 RepID=UPI0025CB9E9A